MTIRPTWRRRAARSSGELYDVVVIGSGFGGAMAAVPLVRAGLRVAMLERGDWVGRGEHNRSWALRWDQREAYERGGPFLAEGESRGPLGMLSCVGGASVFFGGVAMRMRPRDFEGEPGLTGDVRWCLGYGDLAPHYDEAERLLGITGDEADDPTRPPRSRPLPPPALPLSPTSAALADAARRLGLHPFRLPLGLNAEPLGQRPRCTACGTCDGFACAIGAKNDVATAVLPQLVARGLVIRPNTVVCRLELRGGRIVEARCVNRLTREVRRVRARSFVLAAGALATPHILLSSGLECRNPASDVVGRHLMRHCNGVVLGAAPAPWGDAADFRKQVGLHDFYFGEGEARYGDGNGEAWDGDRGKARHHVGAHDGDGTPAGKLGGIQQLRATRIALAMAPLPAGLREALDPLLSRLVGLLVIAEDQPRPENRVVLDRRRIDRYGAPGAVVQHRHTSRDRAARRALTHHARRVLREMGSAFTVTLPVRTFSHALGTVRMGEDPRRFPVAPDGRFRGVENLWISDASVFPTAGAVNPSLTISANALRVGRCVLREESLPPTRSWARTQPRRAQPSAVPEAGRKHAAVQPNVPSAAGGIADERPAHASSRPGAPDRRRAHAGPEPSRR